MSLLDRFFSIIQKIKPGFILMIPVFLGCETADDIGIPYELESNANLNFVEFDLPVSTVHIDSLRTDGENRILVGQFQDDITGSIVTESYFSMKFLSSNIPGGEIEEDFTYDSVRISLFSPTNIGSNSPIQSFNVNLLTDTISDLVYLSSNKQTIDELIGTFESPMILDTNYLNFQLSDEFGNLLFDNVSTFDPLFGSTDWPTLAISPNSNSEVINQITLNNDTTRIYLYVTEPEGASEIKEIIENDMMENDTIFFDTTYVVQFRMDPFQNLRNPHYVNIDRSGISTSIPEDVKVIDPLAGITASISTQPLQDFFDSLIVDDRFIILNDASLVFDLTEQTNVKRDTLVNFYSFFYRNETYFAPATQVNSFSNLVMSDDALLRSLNLPALGTFNTNSDEIVVNAPLFFQALYNDYSNNSEISSILVYEPDGEISLVDFILISQEDITLRQTIFNSVKLRIYYTQVN